MQLSVFLIVMMVFGGALGQKSDCEKFIEKLISDIIDMDFKQLPLPSVMYSGITTNNPGQMEECQNTNYSYYLVYLKNETTGTNTFTGLCVPDQCSAEDIEMALQFLHCKVYDFPQSPDNDGLAIAGAVFISLWLAILIVWSCVISFKEPAINEYLINERTSINAESTAEPLIESVTESQASKQGDDLKIFNYYEGYTRLFKVPSKKSIFSPIIFLAVLGYQISIEFSYRQSISQNQNTTAPELLNSFGGVFICNTEIALHTIMFVLGLRLAYGAYRIKTFRGIGRYFFDQLLKKWILLILMSFLIYSGLTLLTNQPLSKIWSINNGQDCPSYMWQMWFLFRNLQLDCRACLPWISLICSQILFTILAAPFIIIFRVSKKLGYALMAVVLLTSIFASFAILDSENIIFEPTKLMNSSKQFTINYQGNSFVRMGAFFFGLTIGLIAIEGLQKLDDGKTFEYKLAKNVKRSNAIQYGMQLFGLVFIVWTYLSIIPYLDPSNTSQTPYFYMVMAPFGFLIGLALFTMPSFWEGSAKSTNFINSVLGWSKWVHLDRISMTYYMIAPVVIGFTTYSMQSSIYYDYMTVMTYGIGDLFLAYVVSLVCAASFEYQLSPIASWMQLKIFGNQSKYSVLVVED